MADTLTVPVDKIQAVLQACPAISAVERDGIVTRLRAHDVTPAPVVRPELTITYVLVNVNSSFAFPEPTVHHGFDVLKWSGDVQLPYELLHEVSIPHLVVVTADSIYAKKFFSLLRSQKGLQIGALEFLILPNCKNALVDYVDLPQVRQELEGSALIKWAKNSNSIKVITDETTVEAQLERHVPFIVKHDKLRGIRGLNDKDRAQLDKKNEHRTTLCFLRFCCA